MSPRQFSGRPADQAAGAIALFAFILLANTSQGLADPGPAPESISWRSEYNAAYFEAKEADRLIWIQFTGPWCPNCRRMEHDSFPQARIVADAKASFIPVKLRSDENEELALQFNLTALPATVIIDPSNRSIVSLQQGYLGPEELHSLFVDAVARSDKAMTLEKSKLVQAQKKSTVKLANQRDASKNESKLESKNASKGITPAFSGYCIVSLVSTHKLVRGNAAFALEHDGKTYQFANETSRELFRKSPEKFLPTNEGLCPVAGLDREKVIAGDPRFGILYRERLYLCASREDRGQFLRDPERYSVAHVEEKGFCPHCTQEAGKLVKGDPRYSLIRSGREYWFPDPSHRTAFLTSLPTDKNTSRK